MATISYRPSNGTEGDIFMSCFCCRCERDKEFTDDPDEGISCPIVANAFAFGIKEEGYPKEWVRDEGSDVTMIGAPGARCTAFVERGDQIPYRCDKTADLFK